MVEYNLSDGLIIGKFEVNIGGGERERTLNKS